MARVIDKLPPRGNGGAKFERLYPVDEWFDGRVWVILQGEDYRVTHPGMRSNLYNYAKRARAEGYIELRKVWEGDEQIGWAFQFSKYPGSHDA